MAGFTEPPVVVGVAATGLVVVEAVLLELPQPTAAAKPPGPTDLSIEALELTNGTVEITDHSVAPPAALARTDASRPPAMIGPIAGRTPAAIPSGCRTTLSDDCPTMSTGRLRIAWCVILGSCVSSSSRCG